MGVARCFAVLAVAVALVGLQTVLAEDGDEDAADGVRVCGVGGAFAAAVPAFLQHCGPMIASDLPCTSLCNTAFMAIGKYPSCLESLQSVDMDETMQLNAAHGVMPEDALSLTFMMAFSRCHTAAMLPSGPTSPLSKTKCDSVLMAQYEADIVQPFLRSCDGVSSECTEACSHYNSLMRRHPCFPPYFHALRRSSTTESADSQIKTLETVQSANRECALSTSNLKMIRDMCSEENLLRFQDLTWVNFLRSCRSTLGASKNPWQANGIAVEKKHEKIAGAAGADATQATETAPTKDRTCHQQCKSALVKVLSDEYCLQRFEANMAAHGDVGATSLLVDALDMCDETRPATPQYTGVKTVPAAPNSAAARLSSMRLLFLSSLVTLLAALFGCHSALDTLAR